MQRCLSIFLVVAMSSWLTPVVRATRYAPVAAQSCPSESNHSVEYNGQNARARYLNPNTGRFWTMDSFEGSQTDPSSLHKYLYCEANPVNGWDPSGHSLRTQLGTELHSKLGRMFVGEDPLRFSGLAITTIAREIKIPLPKVVDRLLPDLVDAHTKEIYEIKPMTAYGFAGIFQLWGYITAFDALDPSGGWHGGTTWDPPRFVQLSLGFAYISPPVGGMIFYDLETIQDVAKKGARTVGRSDEARLQQEVGISSLLSLMGGF